MARTRAKGGAASSTGASKPPALKKQESRYSLPEETSSPPQLFVLPKTASSESRVVSLQNSRWSRPARYLVCPDTGFYEFTRIAAPSSTPRSWLIEGASVVKDGENDKDDVMATTPETFETHITKDGEIFVATPYDPLFLVLPALASDTGKKRMFLSSDDHIDKLTETSPHLSLILRQGRTQALLEARMAAVCDTVEAGDERMFRLNEGKLLDELLYKARKLSENGLPRSMEERFVTKPLEAPVLTRRSQTQSVLATEDSAVEDSQTPATEKSESQASISSVETSDSATTQASVSTAATTPSIEPSEEETITAAMTPSAEVLSLQRLRVAFNFILSAYLSPPLAAVLNSNLAAADSSTIDFTPLEDYLARLAKLKAEVLASRAATDYSRKRGLDDIEDERAEKRRKKEEEEKRKKAGESRGVKQLKKVNVSGMKKMSDFFKKKT